MHAAGLHMNFSFRTNPTGSLCRGSCRAIARPRERQDCCHGAKCACQFLSLRLFAAQKSTSLVRGRLAPTTSLFVVHGTMWASSPTQREGKWWRRFFALLRMTGRIRNSASLPLAAADVHPPQAFPSRGRLALDITQSIITHKHTTPPRGQMPRGRGCTTY